MVTSNKQSDKKVVKMAEQNNSAVVPQRTLLGEVNEHITCPLCRGYYIDATTIVECLHSFCRSCIIKHLQVKSYCPVCEMMINSAKPNIKLDKALQDIVYKLVPGLFQKEMERRQQFYSSRPGPAASATPEQRGEDTERIIFSPEDVISFSLEYSDATDTDSISSKSSDSNESQPTSSRRYLQCPAVVNINHLKKFLSMKFDIDSTQFAIDILYKRVPLPDYYTLMDIAYIYNWKRNEPMRFFYQIIDYVAIRNRLFDINRKGTQFPDRKSSPTCTEDTNASSPIPIINDQVSEASSGTDSPMPDDNNVKKGNKTHKKADQFGQSTKDVKDVPLNQGNNSNLSPTKKNDDEVEKSQFLNSFELKAKNILLSSSPTKSNTSDPTSPKDKQVTNKNGSQPIKLEDNLKRKFDITKPLPEMKKIKIEIPKVPITQFSNVGTSKTMNVKDVSQNKSEITSSIKSTEESTKNSAATQQTPTPAPSTPLKDTKQPLQQPVMTKPPQQQPVDNSSQKRTVPTSQTLSSPKRKPTDSSTALQPSPLIQKTVSPLKLQLSKPDFSAPAVKQVDTPKPTTKKMPDLKPSIPPISSGLNKESPAIKLRMDLLANNCDPTIDRSKILSQVKTSLPIPNTVQSSGDPLKSLFDSCKINIPSSLSITLTDQKLDPRNPSEIISSDSKKNLINKNFSTVNAPTHKVPSPPVHNYIEILKLPDTDPKKIKTENIADKNNSQNKGESNTLPSKVSNKTSESSAKGPVPNLKPIADTKLGKQSGNYSAPTTFQQTFEQQVQAMQADKRPKVPKCKSQVPKLVPATPKSFSAANKLNNSLNKTAPTTPVAENKTSTALDLSTPHNTQSQLDPQRTKALETMQSIANLAKKQNMHQKMLPLAMSQANVFSNMPNRPLASVPQTLRIPSTSGINQLKLDKINPSASQMNSPRQETTQRTVQVKNTSNVSPTVPSPSYTSNAQPSPRSQTRSPSSSPKLVIAEEKQGTNVSSEQNINQSNQITSTQLSNINSNKTETPKTSPGPSKSLVKAVKPMMPAGKLTGIRQPIMPTVNTNPINNAADFLIQPQLISHAHQAIFRHRIEMQNAWLNAQKQYDFLKNMSNIAHQTQNDFNNKDKQ